MAENPYILLGLLGPEEEMVQQQLARELARRRAENKQHITGLGAALGGAGDLLNAYRASQAQEVAAQRLRELAQERKRLSGQLVPEAAPEPTAGIDLREPATIAREKSASEIARQRQIAEGMNLAAAAAGKYGGNVYADVAKNVGTSIDRELGTQERERAHEMQYGEEARALKRSLSDAKLQNDLLRTILAGQYRVQAAEKKPAAEKPVKPLPNADVKALETMNDMHRVVRELEGEFKDKYAGQSAVGQLKNTWAKYAGSAASPEAQEQFGFWSKFKMFIENTMRHEMFGSAFTSSEQQAWKDAQLLGPQTDPKVVRKRFGELKTQLANKLRGRAKGRMREGYSPEAIREYAPEVSADVPEEGEAPKVRKFIRDATGKLVEQP
jgi:hypothetical protein